MPRHRPLDRRLARIAAIAALLGGNATPASAADPLANVSFAVADTVLFEGTALGIGYGDGGAWSFDRGRMVDGKLELHLEITPPRQTLAVKSGPAVLFGGLALYGDAGGDVGLGGDVAPVVHQAIPACADDDDCSYSVDISIPTSNLPDAIARLERHGDLIWVSADLTLVRTFGAGDWLQVLALKQGPLGIKQAAAGRLGAMEPTTGDIDWMGLFPAGQAKPVSTGNGTLPGIDYAAIVESLRGAAHDVTNAGSMIDVALHVQIEPTCPYWTELTLHDGHGNYLFYANENIEHPLVDASTRMPAGIPWYLTLDAGDGVQRPLVELGPIEPDGSGSALGIAATIDCSKPFGTLELTGAVTPTPVPTRRPLSSVGPPAPTPAPSAVPVASPSTAPVTPATTSDVVAAPLLIATLVAALGTITVLVLRRRAVRS